MRISRDQLWMKIALTMTERGTCFRLGVGCVIVQDNNIVASSYNGPPPGEPHCKGNTCELTPTGGCLRSIHAEANALERMSPYLDPKTCTLYCTNLPCPDCAALIVARRLHRVVYMNDYRIRTGIEIIRDADILVERLTPSGYIINPFTNEVKEHD